MSPFEFVKEVEKMERIEMASLQRPVSSAANFFVSWSENKGALKPANCPKVVRPIKTEIMLNRMLLFA